MQAQLTAEVVVLDRIMYLLEEGSVSHLADKDAQFRIFVHVLYHQVQTHADRLQAKHP